MPNGMGRADLLLVTWPALKPLWVSSSQDSSVLSWHFCTPNRPFRPHPTRVSRGKWYQSGNTHLYLEKQPAHPQETRASHMPVTHKKLAPSSPYPHLDLPNAFYHRLDPQNYLHIYLDFSISHSFPSSNSSLTATIGPLSLIFLWVRTIESEQKLLGAMLFLVISGMETMSTDKITVYSFWNI